MPTTATNSVSNRSHAFKLKKQVRLDNTLPEISFSIVSSCYGIVYPHSAEINYSFRVLVRVRVRVKLGLGLGLGI